jgi:hypothetical protein
VTWLMITAALILALAYLGHYNAAADCYESLCDRLREDAARDKAVRS